METLGGERTQHRLALHVHVELALPGWRVAWTVGPKRVIEKIASAGSFLDGGGSRPLQRAAVPLLEPARWRRRRRRSAGCSARSSP